MIGRVVATLALLIALAGCDIDTPHDNETSPRPLTKVRDSQTTAVDMADDRRDMHSQSQNTPTVPAPHFQE